MRSRAAYETEGASARRTGQALLIIAAVTFAVGWAAVSYALLILLVEAIPGDQLENLLGVLGVGSIVSGIAMFATSWNLRIGASRLAIDLASKLP
ncbi:MAG: hypothetical protein ACKOE2_16460 [Actinomycetales bacterium]